MEMTQEEIRRMLENLQKIEDHLRNVRNTSLITQASDLIKSFKKNELNLERIEDHLKNIKTNINKGGSYTSGPSSSSSTAQQKSTAATNTATKGRINVINRLTQSTGKLTQKVDGGARVFDRLKNTISKVDNKLADIGFSAGRASNSFTDMAGLLKLAGGGVIIGNSITMFAQFIDAGVEALRETSQVGLNFNGSLTEMAIAAKKMGLNLTDFSAIVKDNAVAIKTFGIDRFVELGSTIRQNNKQFINMGLTGDEVQKMLGEYIDGMQHSERFREMDTKSQSAQFTTFMEEMSLVSQATGKSIKEAVAEFKNNAKDFDIQGALFGKSAEQRQMITGMVDTMATAFQVPKDMLIRQIAGLPTGKDQGVFARLGPEIQEVIRQVSQGAIRPENLNKAMFDAAQRVRGNIPRLQTEAEYGSSEEARIARNIILAASAMDRSKGQKTGDDYINQNAVLAQGLEAARQVLAWIQGSIIERVVPVFEGAISKVTEIYHNQVEAMDRLTNAIVTSANMMDGTPGGLGKGIAGMAEGFWEYATRSWDTIMVSAITAATLIGSAITGIKGALKLPGAIGRGASNTWRGIANYGNKSPAPHLGLPNQGPTTGGKPGTPTTGPWGDRTGGGAPNTSPPEKPTKGSVLKAGKAAKALTTMGLADLAFSSLFGLSATDITGAIVDKVAGGTTLFGVDVADRLNGMIESALVGAVAGPWGAAAGGVLGLFLGKERADKAADEVIQTLKDVGNKDFWQGDIDANKKQIDAIKNRASPTEILKIEEEIRKIGLAVDRFKNQLELGTTPEKLKEGIREKIRAYEDKIRELKEKLPRENEFSSKSMLPGALRDLDNYHMNMMEREQERDRNLEQYQLDMNKAWENNIKQNSYDEFLKKHGLSPTNAYEIMSEHLQQVIALDADGNNTRELTSVKLNITDVKNLLQLERSMLEQKLDEMIRLMQQSINQGARAPGIINR